jgi:hypothetical protein
VPPRAKGSTASPPIAVPQATWAWVIGSSGWHEGRPSSGTFAATQDRARTSQARQTVPAAPDPSGSVRRR